ncbi:MAG: hypothetical protein MJ169_04240 [Treponema sp.]|nr:hypothetical protein [Treponema sp.]
MKKISESRKYLLSAVVVTILTCGNLWSAPLDAKKVIPGWAYDKFMANKEMSNRLTVDYPRPALVPLTDYAAKTRSIFGPVQKDLGYGIEKLYLIDKMTLVENSAAYKNNPGVQVVDVSMKAVEKVMRSHSKMKGMQYYSNSRKRYETLYLDSYRVSGPGSKEKLPDLLTGSTDGLTIWALQEDKSMGKNIYRVDYSMNDNQIFMQMTNVDDIYFGIIKGVPKEKLKIVCSVTDLGDSYLVYVAMYGEFPQMGLMEKKMNQSLNARLEAVYKWMIVQF